MSDGDESDLAARVSLASLILMATLWVFVPGPRVVEAPWNLIGVGLGLLGVGLNVVESTRIDRAAAFGV